MLNKFLDLQNDNLKTNLKNVLLEKFLIDRSTKIINQIFLENEELLQYADFFFEEIMSVNLPTHYIAEDFILGFIDGFIKGIIEETKKTSLEIAKKMLATGLSEKQVIEITGLSHQDIESIEVDSIQN